MTDHREWADVTAIAAHLGVSPPTVRRMLTRGLRHVKLDAAQQCRVLVRWDWLEAWLEDHAVEHDC